MHTQLALGQSVCVYIYLCIRVRVRVRITVRVRGRVGLGFWSQAASEQGTVCTVGLARQGIHGTHGRGDTAGGVHGGVRA